MTADAVGTSAKATFDPVAWYEQLEAHLNLLPAGEVAVICVAELTVNEAALFAPNFTAVAPVKLVPVITTDVPPPARPLLGETPVTEGGSKAV